MSALKRRKTDKRPTVAVTDDDEVVEVDDEEAMEARSVDGCWYDIDQASRFKLGDAVHFRVRFSGYS